MKKKHFGLFNPKTYKDIWSGKLHNDSHILFPFFSCARIRKVLWDSFQRFRQSTRQTLETSTDQLVFYIILKSPRDKMNYRIVRSLLGSQKRDQESQFSCYFSYKLGNFICFCLGLDEHHLLCHKQQKMKHMQERTSHTILVLN